MSRITDYILEPKVVYTEGGFLVRVKVIDDYKYKKYIVSENLHYKTVQGTSFTLTDADTTKQASITEIKGNLGKNVFNINNAIDRPSWNNKICDRIITNANNFILKSNATDDWCGIYLENLDTTKNYTIKFTATLLEGVEGNSLYVGTANANSPRTAIYTNTPKEVEYHFTNSSKIYIKIVSQTRVQFTNVQLEIGTQATVFEPYKVVSGDNEIIVSNKNLINIVDRSGTISNFYYYDIPTNYLLEVGETYTVSYDAIVSLEPFNVSVGAGTTGYQRDIKTVTGNVSGRISVTFTPNEYQLALGNKFYIRVPRYNTPQTSNYEIKNIQLEKGNVATEYIEHQESSKNITLARIPSEYQEVEYIQSNGSQYINTGYNLWNTMNWKIQADFSIDEHYNYNAIFGYDDITDTSNEVWIYSNSRYAWRACGGFNGNVAEIPLNTKINIIHDNSGNRFITTLNDNVVWNFNKLPATSNHNLCFGHRAGGGWLKGKIYGLKLWSEGTLVRDFIPCYKISDDIAGLYDTVNNVFYPNANTGSSAQPFISGEKNRTTIQLSENDKLWNNNGTWQLNDTAITDNYLLEQLQALENIELYEDLCYVDFVGNVKADMTLQYAGTEDLGIKYIITEDGKKIRTDWRKLGRRKKWMMK